ncbi:MAG: hypothetical protein V9H69_15040 [Anaerolineae bacterium]
MFYTAIVTQVYHSLAVIATFFTHQDNLSRAKVKGTLQTAASFLYYPCKAMVINGN